MNGAQEVSRGLVVARGNGTVLLEPGKEVLNQVTGLVQLAVIVALVPARAGRRNHHNWALAKYAAPVIVNTDQGNQFTGTEFTEVVRGAGCKLSMDGRGAWWDNVFVERLWRSVKYEHVYKRVCVSLSQAKPQIAQCLDWYNIGRAHSSLDNQMPDQAYWDKLPKLAVAA